MRTNRRRLLATAGVTVALGVTNVVAAPRLARPASAACNLGTTAAVLGLARWAGLDQATIGLDRRELAGGVATGVAGATAVAAALGVVASTRIGRELLDDDRVVDASWPQTVLHVGVLIPLGTVVLEEVAFRGVLPALLDPTGRSVAATVLIPSLAFGAWHIVSSRHFVAAHDHARADGGATGSTPGIVTATTAAGVVLALARRRGGHLAAPALMHFTANALVTVLGRALGRVKTADGGATGGAA